MSNPTGNTLPTGGKPPAYYSVAEQRSIQLAKDFYSADKQLDAGERKQLARLFYNKATYWPFLSLPVCYGFITAPNWLQRVKLVKPRPSWRYWQVALGFAGIFVGLGFASSVATSVQSKTLGDQPNMLNAYRILAPYPAQLGSRYYQLTSQRPDLAMQDPEKIDWSKEILFPMILIFSRNNIHAAKEQVEKLQERRSGMAPKSSSEPTHSSWDKVIERGSAPKSPSPVKTEDQLQFDKFVENTKPDTYERELTNDQKAFDQLVEREREGETLQDDFSESEKRWS